MAVTPDVHPDYSHLKEASMKLHTVCLLHHLCWCVCVCTCMCVCVVWCSWPEVDIFHAFPFRLCNVGRMPSSSLRMRYVYVRIIILWFSGQMCSLFVAATVCCQQVWMVLCFCLPVCVCRASSFKCSHAFHTISFVSMSQWIFYTYVGHLADAVCDPVPKTGAMLCTYVPTHVCRSLLQRNTSLFPIVHHWSPKQDGPEIVQGLMNLMVVVLLTMPNGSVHGCTSMKGLWHLFRYASLLILYWNHSCYVYLCAHTYVPSLLALAQFRAKTAIYVPLQRPPNCWKTRKIKAES